MLSFAESCNYGYTCSLLTKLSAETRRDTGYLQANYWSTALAKRITRRRALVTTAGGAAAAAFLAACGGSNSSSAPATPASSLLDKPNDTTSKAVRGGIMVRQVL